MQIPTKKQQFFIHAKIMSTFLAITLFWFFSGVLTVNAQTFSEDSCIEINIQNGVVGTLCATYTDQEYCDTLFEPNEQCVYYHSPDLDESLVTSDNFQVIFDSQGTNYTNINRSFISSSTVFFHFVNPFDGGDQAIQIEEARISTIFDYDGGASGFSFYQNSDGSIVNEIEATILPTTTPTTNENTKEEIFFFYFLLWLAIFSGTFYLTKKLT